MVLFDMNPTYNTILCFFIIVSFILLFKPESMYCNKSKRFKSFGTGNNQTIFCFPLICFLSVIVLYIVFLTVDIINGYLEP